MSMRARLSSVHALWTRGRLFRYVWAKLLARTGLCRRLLIRIDDYVLRFHPSALCVTLWTDPADRQRDRDDLRRLLHPGDVVIDVGANIGDLTACAARAVGPGGRVYAIEPHPRIFQFLQDNVALNAFTHVILHNVAVGASNGGASLSDRRSDDQNALVSTTLAGGEGHVMVSLRRLDALGIPPGPIRLLKIDVEGHERSVLEGASGLLPSVDFVYYESWERHFALLGHTTGDVVRLLEHHGFHVHRMDADGRLERVAASHVSVECENLLGVRASGDAVNSLQPSGSPQGAARARGH